MDWWKDAETFHTAPAAVSNPGMNGSFDWGTLAEGKFTFTTHCPVDKNFFDRCHRLGVRCFPYVSFYFGSDHFSFGTIKTTIYQGVDYSTPEGLLCFEWSQALARRAWEFPTNPPTGPTGDGVGVMPDQPAYLVCPNYGPYQDKMVAWVNYIMEQGADGIYVDNLRMRAQCHRFGNDAGHTHIYADKTMDPVVLQNQAFGLLLQRVRAVVKKHRPDGLVFGNSGDPLNKLQSPQGNQTWPGFQPYLDADTLEGYASDASWQNNTLSWDQLGRDLQSYITTEKKQILAISALSSTPGDLPLGFPSNLRSRAFLSYCSARVAGFIWAGGPMQMPDLADLHRVRLGQALAPGATDPASQINYRVFESGIVAVNWTSNAGSLPARNIAAAALAMNQENVRFFYDLFTSPAGNCTDTDSSAGLLAVPAFSGRVFLFASSTNYALGLQVPPPAPSPAPHVHPPAAPPPINHPSGPPNTFS